MAKRLCLERLPLVACLWKKSDGKVVEVINGSARSKLNSDSHDQLLEQTGAIIDIVAIACEWL